MLALCALLPTKVPHPVEKLPAETTHGIFKRKYHCTNDLLFDWFGFDQTRKSVVNST